MGLPSKKRTPRSKKERASHFALKPKTARTCESCGAVVLPHCACKKCGNYKGKTIINKEKRVTRSLKKNK